MRAILYINKLNNDIKPSDTVFLDELYSYESIIEAIADTLNYQHYEIQIPDILWEHLGSLVTLDIQRLDGVYRITLIYRDNDITDDLIHDLMPQPLWSFKAISAYYDRIKIQAEKYDLWVVISDQLDCDKIYIEPILIVNGVLQFKVDGVLHILQNENMVFTSQELMTHLTMLKLVNETKLRKSLIDVAKYRKDLDADILFAEFTAMGADDESGSIQDHYGVSISEYMNSDFRTNFKGYLGKLND